MRLSGGYVFRYREWEGFRAECPGGDPALQRLVWERFDDALAWLRGVGAPVLEEETGNPLTVGVRLDVERTTEALAARGGDPARRAADRAAERRFRRSRNRGLRGGS